jgi:hypothetical protein
VETLLGRYEGKIGSPSGTVDIYSPFVITPS